MRKGNFYTTLVKHSVSSEIALAGLTGARTSLKLNLSLLNSHELEPQVLFIFRSYFYQKIPSSCNVLLLCLRPSPAPAIE